MLQPLAPPSTVKQFVLHHLPRRTLLSPVPVMAATGTVVVSGALVVRGHLDELQLLRAARIVNPDTPIARARGEKWQGGRPGDAGYSVRVTFQNSNAFP